MRSQQSKVQVLTMGIVTQLWSVTTEKDYFGGRFEIISSGMNYDSIHKTESDREMFVKMKCLNLTMGILIKLDN